MADRSAAQAFAVAPRSSCGTRGQPEPQRPSIEPDLVPAGNLPHRQPPRRTVLRDEREVTVIAGGGHRGADRRVDIPAGLPGCAQRYRHGLGQQRADRHAIGAARRCRIHRDELGVGAKPAARRIHGGQVGGEQAAPIGQLARVGDDQPDLSAERLPVGVRRRLGGCGGGTDGHHEPPDAAWLVPELAAGAAADPAPDMLEPDVL